MAFEGKTLTVVIPAHNEAAFIRDVIGTMPDCVDTIIVVDDASTDGTAEIARSLGDPRVQLLILPSNRGVGGAMAAGYRRAVESGTDLIVKMDGDGQMAPEYLTYLLNPLIRDGYAYAKGNRFLVGIPGSHMPRHRLLGNMALTFLTKIASGYWHIFDPQNGYTAISAEALRTIDLTAVHKGYFFENDMLVHLNLNNHRVKDVPIPPQYGRETSGIRPIRIGLTFPVLLLQRFLYRIYQKYVLRDFSPIALFLLTGALLFSWGIGFGVFLWVRGRMLGVATPTGTIMLAIVPLFLGFQLLLQALVLDIQETPK